MEIIHAYGATETSPLVCYNFVKPGLQLSGEERWELRRKQGIPVFGVEVKIVDENGKELPRDGKSIGELLIRGHWVTGSYYNDPATFGSFEGDIVRWWKSGDAATIDEHGYIKIVDRFKGPDKERWGVDISGGTSRTTLWHTQRYLKRV